MPANRIYLDYNATTPVDPEVLQAMLPWFTEKFGNAASNTHSFGWEAAEAVKIAREQIAELIGAIPEEIIFTSGSTESINLSLKGVAEAYRSKGYHIITAKTEHKAVLDSCAWLEKNGCIVTYLDVNSSGKIDLEELSAAITPQTIIVSIMMANNETGVIEDVKSISSLAHERGVLFMSDGTQAVGKLEVNVNDLGIDLLPISAHKIYGPKGAGALYVRRKNPRVGLSALLHGGGHEKGLRSGTLNVPGIVGLGKAASLAKSNLDSYSKKTSALRDRLENELTSAFPFISVNGKNAGRLPNTSNLLIRGVASKELISKIPSVAFSSGSACTSALPQPSHVLAAMGLTEEGSYSSIRISLGRFTTEDEVTKAIGLFTEAIRKIKG